MATISNASKSQVRLSNGQIVSAQQGGWYDGQQFWGGTLSNPGQINPLSNQQGAGQAVSKEVIAQTNPNNVSYVNQQRQQLNLTPSPTVQNPTPVQPEQVVAPQTAPATQAMATPQTASPNGQAAAGVFAPGGQTTTQANSAGLGLNMQMAGGSNFDITKVYEAAKNNPDLVTAQTDYDNAQKGLADAESKINDNPFLSEATRVGRIAKLHDQADKELTRLQNKISSLNADAETKVNLSLKQYDINSQEYQKNLSYLNTLISTGAIAGANQQDLSSLASMTGISTDMLQTIVKKAVQGEPPQIVTSVDDHGTLNIVAIDTKTGKVIGTNKVAGVGEVKQNPPDVISSTDANGNLLLTTIDKNTGKVIGTSTVAGMGGTKSDPKATKDQFEQDKVIAPQYATQAAKSGKTLADMMSFYGQWLDKQQIFDIYNSVDYYHASDAQRKADKKRYGVK